MINVDQLLQLHSWLMDKTGGTNGLRNKAALENAISRPFASFNDQELYPNTYGKAAAVLESMIINRPFVDGNKLTATYLVIALLMEDGQELTASENEMYDFALKVSSGKLNTNQIGAWIESSCSPINA